MTPETATSAYRRRAHCRACGEERLDTFLHLGPQPLANALLSDESEFDQEVSYPLDLCLCGECGLVQIPDVIDAETLFGHYLYVTGVSSSIHDHNRSYAERVVHALELGSDDLVVEVASNDGSLLRRFQDLGVQVLGVEPAANIAAMARAQGVPTECVFFDAETAAQLKDRHGEAAAVIGNNVLAHVEETAGFLAGMATFLRPGGMAVVEVPYLGEFVDQLEYDTVYHEHHCYFSVWALLRVATRAGLVIRDLERVSVHGGSVRVWFGRAEDWEGHASIALGVAEGERASGLTSLDRYRRFAADVEGNRADLLALLRRLRDEGATVAGYGAPAKGNTLLNFCGIGPDLLPYTVDRNPLKVGRYLPGTHIPVLEVAEIERQSPDYLLILPWNFADEIMGQQADFRARGGRFILPIPTPRIL